jgi:hypothetical protein
MKNLNKIIIFVSLILVIVYNLHINNIEGFSINSYVNKQKRNLRYKIKSKENLMNRTMNRIPSFR